MRTTHTLSALICLGATAAAAASSCGGGNNTWAGGGSGNWTTGGNWSQTTTPDATDRVVFDATTSVAFPSQPSPATICRLNVRYYTTTLTLSSYELAFTTDDMLTGVVGFVSPSVLLGDTSGSANDAGLVINGGDDFGATRVWVGRVDDVGTDVTDGHLTLTNGAQAEIEDLHVAQLHGTAAMPGSGPCTVTVEDASSLDVARGVIIGIRGVAAVGDNSVASLTLADAGSSLVCGHVEVSAVRSRSGASTGGGLLTVGASTTLEATYGLSVSDGGAVTGIGEIVTPSGVVAMHADGVLAPGSGSPRVGLLTINGVCDLSYEGGTNERGFLDIVLAAHSPTSSFGRIEITDDEPRNHALLGGVLRVTFGNALDPIAGDVYQIVTTDTDSCFGRFAILDAPALDPGLYWNIVYADDGVSLEVQESAGDANGDGDITEADVLIVTAQYGSSGPGLLGDVDYDGDVDDDDMDIVLEFCSDCE